MQRDLLSVSSLAVESHLQHGIFETIHFNLEIPFGSFGSIVEAISLHPVSLNQYRLKFLLTLA